MLVLLLNAGSSSLKFSLMESTNVSVRAQGMADWSAAVTRYRYSAEGGAERTEQVTWRGPAATVRRALHDLTHADPIAVPELAALTAVGHRVVHGGDFTAAVKITPEIREKLAALTDVAPLHNPPSLEALAAAEAELPNVPQLAIFDTAFHATIPPEAHRYPVPESWARDWGIRRYGFHGLSHAYCAKRAAAMMERPADGLRLVICHLGHGCSATAVRSGRSIDTTMGFTPLEGLMMATRSGSIDPGIVLHVQQRHGLTPQQVDIILNRQSGLLGMSGVSGDMREVLAATRTGNEQAHLALEVYTHRVRQAIGALAATLGGVDALIFTGGVGENAAEVRAKVCTGLEFMGLKLDTEINGSCRPDADVAQRTSRGRILVIAAREDLSMLEEVIRVLGTPKQV